MNPTHSADDRRGTTMLQPRTERLVIMLGIMVGVIGALAAAAGVWSMQSARQFQATALRTTARVVPSGHPNGAVRFTTDNGHVVEASMPQGRSEPVGSTVKILYERGNPHRWVIESGYEPGHGLGLAAAGAAILLGGVALAAVGVVSRRKRGPVQK
jgi:hypothetical protein